jgi:hypothetical protein
MKRLHSCFFENSFDRWQDIYRLQKGEVTPKRGQKRWEFESDVPTRNTKGGIVYDKTVKNNDPKGWSAEGILRYNKLYATSEKDSTCILPFVHPNVHVITCSSFMWPEMHASTEEFTRFLYVCTPLVIASHNLFPRGQKESLTTRLIHAN